MDCSIIIVNWNTKDLLRQCLDAVAAQDLGAYRVETFVVDNASRDGSPDLVRQGYPWVHLIENNQNLGFARANNQAIRLSNGKFILLLNSDAFMAARSLAEMLSVIDPHPEIGILGPRLVYSQGADQISHGPLPTYWSELFSLLGLDKLSFPKGSAMVETGYVSGACFLVRRAVIAQIGLLDEDYFFFTEETDFCARAKNAGWKVVYLPSVEITHLGGGSTGHHAERILLLYEGKLLYFAKHFDASSRQKLLNAMRTISRLKFFVYRLLKLLTFGRVRKDLLWQHVVQGLQTV